MTTFISWTPNELITDVERVARSIMITEGAKAVDEIRASFTRGSSSPGQTPGIRSGRLSRDITFEFTVLPMPSLKVGVQAANPYALVQELGSPSRRIRPRPFIRPQLPRSLNRILTELTRALT